jgi:hypothetical protein
MITSLKSMDKLFWGKEFEDILDWMEWLEMAFEVCECDEMKLFKIVKLNMRGKAKDWFKKLQLATSDWNEMKTSMQYKFNDVNFDEIIMKMDVVK